MELQSFQPRHPMLMPPDLQSRAVSLKQVLPLGGRPPFRSTIHLPILLLLLRIQLHIARILVQEVPIVMGKTARSISLEVPMGGQQPSLPQCMPTMKKKKLRKLISLYCRCFGGQVTTGNRRMINTGLTICVFFKISSNQVRSFRRVQM